MKFFKRKKPAAVPSDESANQPKPDSALSAPKPVELPQSIELAPPDVPEAVKPVEPLRQDIPEANKPGEVTPSELEPGTDPAQGASAAPPSADLPEEDGFFTRIRRGLSRTSDSLFSGLGNLFLGKKEIDAELLEELESRLLMADVGVDATMEIIERLTQRVSRKELTHPEALQSALREELLQLLKPCQQPNLI